MLPRYINNLMQLIYTPVFLLTTQKQFDLELKKLFFVRSILDYGAPPHQGLEADVCQAVGAKASRDLRAVASGQHQT